MAREAAASRDRSSCSDWTQERSGSPESKESAAGMSPSCEVIPAKGTFPDVAVEKVSRVPSSSVAARQHADASR